MDERSGGEEQTDDEGAAELADQMEERAQQMEGRTDELEDEIEDVEGDWEAKQSDERVPGAQDEPGAGEGERSEDE